MNETRLAIFQPPRDDSVADRDDRRATIIGRMIALLLVTEPTELGGSYAANSGGLLASMSACIFGCCSARYCYNVMNQVGLLVLLDTMKEERF